MCYFDKCYENNNSTKGFKEVINWVEDPYSGSKSLCRDYYKYIYKKFFSKKKN